MVKKAVLVGINYKGSDAQLNGCINDIRNINNILINNCEYKSENIRILTEEHAISPTKKNMEDNINWLVRDIKAGDTLIFYYSGHGANINDRNGDETDGKDEVLVPLDYNANGVISDDWLFTNMANKVPQNATLWSFTDCCHSGTMIDLKYNYKSLCALKSGQVRRGMKYNSNEWNDRFSFSMEKGKDIVGNVYLFSGCQDQETSADATINRLPQGAFTFCFTEFIKENLEKVSDNKFRFKSGTVKLRNILKEINCRLDINGFTGQNSQLSICKMTDFERTLDL
jgi:hypothetical protein